MRKTFCRYFFAFRYYPGAGGQGAYFQAGMTGPQGAGVRPYYGGGGGGGMGVSGGPFPGATGIVGAEGDQQGEQKN